MNTRTLAPPRSRLAAQGLLAAAPTLALGLIALGLLFHEEIGAAIGVWIASTAYNHCFLIIPIAAYLVWDRRERLAGVVARPIPILALAVLPLSLAWLAAERVGIMEGRQLVALTCVQVLFLAVLGWRAYRLLCGPLLYLYFLVPFGDFLTPALQDITTFFVMHGLDLLGVANYTDGYTIQIPEGTFFIAEACAGLRFLIASVAFGCLYALLIYRSWWRRACYIAVGLVVPVIANGFRALGIVMLGHLLGSAQAAETDHILYGWIFFSIVILILVALGLPFREDVAAASRARRPAPAPASAPSSRRLAAAAASVLILSAIGPATAFALTRAAGQAGAPIDLAGAGGCQAEPSEPPEAGSPAVRHYTCDGLGIILQAETFPPRIAPRPMLQREQLLTRGQGAEDVTTHTLRRRGLPWTLTQTDSPSRLAASLLWEDGAPVRPGLRFRLRRVWHSIAGGSGPSVLVVLTPDPDTSGQGPDGRRRAHLAIERFLDTGPDLASILDAVAPAR